MVGIKIYVQKQICEGIERLGGISIFLKKDSSDHSLYRLLETNTEVYGYQGDTIRTQLQNLLKRWGNYSAENYQKKVLDKFKVTPLHRRYCQEVESDKDLR